MRPVALCMVGVANSASAQTIHTSPFGRTAVEVYMGYRTDNWFEGHTIVWKRKNDGRCESFRIDRNGENRVIGSYGDDLMKVVVATETISCSNGQTMTLIPFQQSTSIQLSLEGREGHDVILVARPTREAHGHQGNDLVVVVDETNPVLFGGTGHDQLESWSTTATSLLHGDSGNDCLWNRRVQASHEPNLTWCGSGDYDKSNATGALTSCEEVVTCCPFGAWMGACTP
jgi:hypothetical protein